MQRGDPHSWRWRIEGLLAAGLFLAYLTALPPHLVHHAFDDDPSTADAASGRAGAVARRAGFLVRGIGVGPSETLKGHRGWAMVHLVLFALPASLGRLEQLDAAWSTIAGVGARIIAVPMRDADEVYRRLGARAVNFPLAVDGAEEIAETYALFRRTASNRVPPVPSHVEFLVDRQGYIRARWIPGEETGWADIARLLREIERLDKEAPRAPAPEEHVH